MPRLRYLVVLCVVCATTLLLVFRGVMATRGDVSPKSAPVQPKKQQATELETPFQSPLRCSVVPIECLEVEGIAQWITGFVYDSISGEPVTDGRVSDTTHRDHVSLDPEGEFSYVTEKDAVLLTVTATGYEDKTIDVRTGENRVEHISVALRPVAVCRVLVVHESGTPVAGATIRARDRGTLHEFGPWRQAGRDGRLLATTGTDGIASLPVAREVPFSVAAPDGGIAVGLASVGGLTTVVLKATGARLRLANRTGQDLPAVHLFLRHTSSTTSSSTEYDLHDYPLGWSPLLSEGHWTILVRDENARIISAAIDDRQHLAAVRAQEISVDVQADTHNVDLIVDCGIPIRIVDAESRQGIEGPFVYTQNFLLSNSVWQDGIARAGKASKDGLAYVVDLDDFRYQFSVVVPGYCPTIVEEMDLANARITPPLVPLARCGEYSLTLKFSNNDLFRGYVQVRTIGGVGAAIRLFQGFVGNDGRLPSLTVPAGCGVEILDSSGARIALVPSLRFSDPTPEVGVVLDVSFGRLAMTNIPPGVELPAVIDSLGYAHKWRVDARSRMAETAALLPGTYFVGPRGEAVRASEARLSLSRRQEVSPAAVAVVAASVTSLTWQQRWGSESGASGHIHVCAVSAPSLIVVPVFAGESRLYLGSNTPRFRVRGSDGYYDTGSGPLPSALLVCSQMYDDTLVPLKTILPGQSVTVASCDLEVVWSGDPPTNFVALEIAYAEDEIGHGIRLGRQPLNFVWNPATPLRVAGLPPGATTITARSDYATLATHQVILDCAATTSLQLK